MTTKKNNKRTNINSKQHLLENKKQKVVKEFITCCFKKSDLESCIYYLLFDGKNLEVEFDSSNTEYRTRCTIMTEKEFFRFFREYTSEYYNNESNRYSDPDEDNYGEEIPNNWLEDNNFLTYITSVVERNINTHTHCVRT